jgi:Fe-S-cluster containining protein
VDFTYPANIHFECNQCGLCCGDTKEKTRHILLLESEAHEISAKTGLPIEGFAVEAANGLPYVYEIKKLCQGKCIFLENSQCTIYNSRPLICRFYPFELRFDQNKETYIFNYTIECPKIGEGKALTIKDFEELFFLAKQRLP